MSARGRMERAYGLASTDIFGTLADFRCRLDEVAAEERTVGRTTGLQDAAAWLRSVGETGAAYLLGTCDVPSSLAGAGQAPVRASETRLSGADGAGAGTGTRADGPAVPGGCRWCGIEERGHARQHVPEVGWHAWTAPTDAQRKERMIARRTQAPAPQPDPVVAYRNPDRPDVLLCREHGDGWQGLVALTSDDLPDGGVCTYGRPSATECGRDVLAPWTAPQPECRCEGDATDNGAQIHEPGCPGLPVVNLAPASQSCRCGALGANGWQTRPHAADCPERARIAGLPLAHDLAPQPETAPDACPRCGRPAAEHDRPCTISTAWPGTAPDAEPSTPDGTCGRALSSGQPCPDHPAPTVPDDEVARLRDRVDEVERKYTFDTAALKARVAELESAIHVAMLAMGVAPESTLGTASPALHRAYDGLRDAWRAGQVGKDTGDATQAPAGESTQPDAALRARVAELEALAADATEHRILLPEHGGVELLVRRSSTGLAGGGWAVSTMARGGGRAWTQEGWQEAISALSVDRLFCWPTAETALAEARAALGLPDAEQGGDRG